MEGWRRGWREETRGLIWKGRRRRQVGEERSDPGEKSERGQVEEEREIKVWR